MCIWFPKILDTQPVKNSQLKLYSSQKPILIMKLKLISQVQYIMELNLDVT